MKVKGKYVKREHYSRKELERLFVKDLIGDAEQSEKQASFGPFYPERGITKESLLNYALECRERAKNARKELSAIHLKFFTPARDCLFAKS